MEYRLCFLDSSDERDRVLTFQTASDDLAIEFAAQKATMRPIELWDRCRLVIRLRPASWPGPTPFKE